MADEIVGFIGLGNMGRPMAANVAGMGHDMVVHDLAGSAERAPAGAAVARDNRDLARRADIIVLSLPTVAANQAVAREVAAAAKPGTLVLDTCTIGVQAAKENAAVLDAAGIGYLDSPVSGLAVRAREGTLATMCAGPAELVARARPVIEGYSRVVFHIGNEPGQGQRMKLVNNALCISQYVITAEALVYGENGGLDMATMLDVINESSGMNFSTSFVFPRYVVNGNYDESGSEAHVPCKDLGLFVSGSDAEGTPNDALRAAYEIFKAFADDAPHADQMRVFPFVKAGSGKRRFRS